MASWETKGTRTQGGTEGIPFFGGKKKGKTDVLSPCKHGSEPHAV